MKKFFLFIFALVYVVSLFSNINYSNNYEKAQPLYITSTSPTSNSRNYQTIKEIVFTFNKPILSIESVRDLNVNYKITPYIKGIFRSRGTNTLVFIPEKPFIPYKKYTFTLLKGITANDGSILKQNYKLTIMPVAVRVKSIVIPLNNEFDTDSLIHITLNYYLNKNQLFNSINIKEDQNKTPVHFTILTNDTIIDKTKPYKFKIKITDKLKSNTKYLIEIFNKDLSISPYTYSFTTYGDFYFDTNCISSKISLSYDNYINLPLLFSNSLSPKKFNKYVKLIDEKGDTQKLTILNHEPHRVFIINYDFEPQTKYHILISPKLKDIHNNFIKNPGLYSFETGDYNPFLYSDENYINTKNHTYFNIQSMNIDSFNLYVKFFNIKDFIKFLNYSDFEKYKEKMIKKNILIKYSKNKIFTHKYNLNTIYKNNTPLGIGFVEYTINNDTFSNNFYFQKSDINMHFIISNKNAYAIAYNREHYAPENFGKILLYSNNGSIKGRFPVKDNFLIINKNKINQFFTKNYKSKFLYGIFKGDNVLLAYNRNYIKEYNVVYTFTDRNLYSLNDSVIISGIIRKKHANIIENTNISHTQYKVINSNYKIIQKGEININKNGYFKLIVPISDTAMTGNYSVVFQHLGRTYFEVQEFKKPTFEVIINNEKDTYYKKDFIKININGKYLSGIPMNNDSLCIEFNVYKTNPHFKKYAKYNFHIDNDTIEIKNPILKKSYTLNSKGKKIFREKLSYNGFNPISINAICTIKNKNKEAISKNTYFTYYPRSTYAGLLIETDSLKDDSLKIQYILINTKEKPIRNKKLHLLVLKSINIYFTVADTVFDKVLTTKNTPGYIYLEKEDKYYYKAFLTYDNNTVSYTYNIYQEYYKNIYERVISNIILDKNSYSIGDTAKIKIINTVKKNAWLNIFYGTDSIFDFTYLPINNDTIYYNIPITENLQTGFYFNTFISSDDSLIDKGLNSVFVNVDNSIKIANYDISTDKEIYKPGDSVEINIENNEDSEIGMIITVIDEATLMLKDYSIKNPFDTFYSTYSSYFDLFSSYENLMSHSFYGYYDDLDFSMETERAWGSSKNDTKYLGIRKKESIQSAPSIQKLSKDKEIHIRKNFAQTVYYKYIIIPKNKNRIIKFKISDSISKFRIDIIGFTKDKFNKKSINIQTQKKLSINSMLPNFLRPYDNFKINYLIIDNSNYDDSIITGIKKSNLICDKKTISYLGKIKQKTINFSVKTPFEDTINILLFAEKDSLSDYIEQKIPVINNYLYETYATYYALEDSSIEKINIDSTIIKRKSTLSISMNSSEIAQMELPLKYLKDYPYLCLEQKLSRILPFLIGEQIINNYNLSNIKGRKLRKYVKNILKQISKYQDKNSGGFKYYTDSKYVNEYLSIYTMYVIYNALKNDYTIDKKIINLGLNYLDNVVNHINNRTVWNYNQFAKLSLKAEALYVLSLYGKNYYYKDVEYVFNNRDKLYLSSKARLYETLLIYQMNDWADTLRNELLSSINIEAQYAYFDDNKSDCWLFQNELKNSAVVLTSLLRSNKKLDNDYKIIKFFQLRMKNGMWVNTHTTAVVIEALTEYFKKYEQNNINFNISTYLNNKKLFTEKFKGYNKKQLYKTLQLKDFNEGENVLKMIKQGSGRLYYTLKMKYARKHTIKPLFNGFEVHKTITDVKGNKVNKIVKGNIYKINLEIITNKSRVFVNIDDPLPAGFDIIKRSFVSEAINQKKINRNKNWWGGFSHEEFYKDRVIANALYLSKGTHNYTYYVRAIVSGSFSMPPTNVFEMYTPEVFGHTGSKIINIQ